MQISNFFSNLPWRTDGNVSFLYLTPEQNRAIAIAVNNHDRIVEANKRLRQMLKCAVKVANDPNATHTAIRILNIESQNLLSELGGE
ncbi:hypothetical protein EFU53_000545 [Vibrio cholerae]